MKKKSTLLLVASLSILSFIGCRKNVDVQTSLPIANNVEIPKLLKYLSITLGVPLESIQVDAKTKEFFIPNTVFRSSIEETSKQYSAANNYKAQHEN